MTGPAKVLLGVALIAQAPLSSASSTTITIKPSDVIDLTQLRDELLAAIKEVGSYYVYQKSASPTMCDVALFAVPSKIKLSYKRATNVDVSGGVAIPIVIVSPTLKAEHKSITTVNTDVSYDIDWPKGSPAKSTISPSNALYDAKTAGSAHARNVASIRYLVESMIDSNMKGAHTKPCIAKLGSVPFTTSFQVNNSGGLGLAFFGITLGASKENDTTQTIEIDYDFTKQDDITIPTSQGPITVHAGSKPLAINPAL